MKAIPERKAKEASKVENSSLAKRKAFAPRVLLDILIALLSLAGLGDALYLTIEHLTGQTVRCSVTSGCSEVLSSSYATVGPVPLAAFGVLAYFSAFSLATLACFGYSRARNLLYVLAAAMLAVTLWLLYVQAFVLRAFCQYCLLSAAITISLFLILLARMVIERRKRLG
jgi:uncharacterized membrane protein